MKFVREFFKTLSYCKSHKRMYLWGIAALVIVDLGDICTPFAINWGLMSLTRGDADFEAPWIEGFLPPAWFGPDALWGGAWVYGVLYFSFIVTACIFRYWMSMNFARASIDITTSLRNRFYAHVQRLPSTWHDRTTTGTIMSLATNDMDAVRMFWGFGLLLFIDFFLLMIYGPMVMSYFSVELMLVCLIPLPLIPIAVGAMAKRVEDRFEELQQQFEVLSAQASESFNGAKVVKSFASEDFENKRYAGLSGEFRRRGLRLAKVFTLEHPLLMLLFGMMDLIVVAYGGYLVLQGRMSWNEFVAFFFVLMKVTWPMIALGWVMVLFQRAMVSRRRIEAILNIEPEIRDGEDAVVIDNPAGKIEIRNLTFHYYTDQEPALSDLNLTVEPGMTVALVGEVGSGKSTLSSLIPRLYNPPAGTIFIDGVDVRDLKLEWLRSSIAVVPQETFLFSETILENIGYGLADRQPDPEKLKGYARLARVEDDILEFPRAYQTMLGERGVNLSGGQKQRIAIARALACEPLILILDDCLSAVDSHTEEAILEGLKGQMSKRTALVVSHRVSSIRHADLIVVMEGGRIIERGPHQELLDLGGWYADLARRQQLEAEIQEM